MRTTHMLRHRYRVWYWFEKTGIDSTQWIDCINIVEKRHWEFEMYTSITDKWWMINSNLVIIAYFVTIPNPLGARGNKRIWHHTVFTLLHFLFKDFTFNIILHNFFERPLAFPACIPPVFIHIYTGGFFALQSARRFSMTLFVSLTVFND